MVELGHSSAEYTRTIQPAFIAFRARLEILLNRPNAAGLRQSFQKGVQDARQSRTFLLSQSRGVRHSVYDSFGKSAIALGKALYQVEREYGVPSPARRKRAIEALGQEQLSIRETDGSRSQPIPYPLAEAIHDFSLNAYLERKEKRERTMLLSGGAMVTLISASLLAHEWLGNKEQPSPTRVAEIPTLVQPIPTGTQRIQEKPTKNVPVPNPDRSIPRTASTGWASLIETYGLDVPLPSGRVPIREIGYALSDDALPSGRGSDIRSAILSYLQEFNMFSNGRAAVALGEGGETIVTSERTDNGIRLVVDDLAPISVRTVSYDTKTNLCTVSYTDNSGETRTTDIVLDPHDPEKLCVFTMSTRKQTIGAIRLNSQGQPEVYIVITSVQ